MYDHKELQLRESGVMPTTEVLAEVLGESFIAYETFQETLPRLEMQHEWQWYKPHKAWFGRGWHRWTTLRGTKKEKTLYWLYVYDGYFSVTVWFLDKNRLELLKADMSAKTKEMIKESSIFANKLKTFPVTIDILDSASLAEVYTLIECKKRLER